MARRYLLQDEYGTALVVAEAADGADTGDIALWGARQFPGRKIRLGDVAEGARDQQALQARLDEAMAGALRAMGAPVSEGGARGRDVARPRIPVVRVGKQDTRLPATSAGTGTSGSTQRLTEVELREAHERVDDALRRAGFMSEREGA